MDRLELTYRQALNNEQVQILELLYKFRFVTVATLKEYFIESNPGMDVFRRLETLEQQGFIAKRYFDNYKLLHKPVAYYLLPAGARKLGEYRDEDDTDEINIKGIYRDSMVREQFVMHCVAVFGLYSQLMADYGDGLDFLSKSDQYVLNNLPKPLPDAYLTLQTDNMKYFFLDIVDDDAHLLIDVSKKIKRYFDYRMSGEWAAIGSEFPVIVFICRSEAACKKVRKRCDAAIRKAWIRDIEFRVITKNTVSLD
ncbi:MAG TPA: replication-relaxation family protein [Candidatus Saccharimonadales bacterium]|nr:replication-relaxation family protein [Candidatus Saccharimonadales bacterium]